MKETTFKVLVYGNEDRYVDANLLDKGIYYCEIPFLYNKKATIDNLSSLVELFYGKEINKEEYIKNLKQCQLMEVNLVFYSRFFDQ